MRAAIPAAFAAALLLVSCRSDAPDETADENYPALWEVVGADGRVEGWLFGTVHALPRDLEWRSATFDKVADGADLVVVEVSGLDEREVLEDQFRALAFDSAPRVPLAGRLGSARAEKLRSLLGDRGVNSDALDMMETWAAALAIAQMGRIHASAAGADRVILAEFRGREIVELEGAGPQLAIFDALPEAEQRDLLAVILDEVVLDPDEKPDLAGIWAAGDLAGLEEITGKGILADPELREALLVARNRAWATQIEKLFTASARPLVAVGAGHLLGPDGLPALLEGRGYEVRRIQ